MQVTEHMTTGQPQAGWNAASATAFSAAVLVGAEFLPVSLLTPMAADFDVTEGLAGQAISISGVVAVATSLSVARLTATIDRRIVLAGLMLALLLSSLIVASAANFIVLMEGRALLGVAVGGFWSFSTAVTMRLLPPRDVSGVIGSWWIGRALRCSLFRPLILLPALMGAVAVGMINLAHLQAAVVVLFLLWGFLAAAAPVGWGQWLSRALPNDAEAGGGLQVAAIQIAIALAALIGGRVLDGSGWQAAIAFEVAVLLAASAAAAVTAVHFTRTPEAS